jgi:hypothetical protein
LGSSLKKEADATLFLELTLRGYDLSRLRDDKYKTEKRKQRVQFISRLKLYSREVH